MEENKQPFGEENPVSPEDQLALARSYANGKGREQDYAQAAYWYEKAAAQGNPAAANYLGVLYGKGQGVEKDPVRAAALYRQAAEAGHIMGAKNLADCCRMGKGLEKDYVQAAYWYEKAATAGNDKAAVQLGLLYARGNGMEKDHAKAAVWYQQAADKENTDALNYLGVLYEFGRGVESDPLRATELYRKAAEAGHARAACNLANCYRDGKGVPQDYTQAACWYEKATEGGIADAFNSLALLYDNGNGVPMDEARAADLYWEAADKDHPMGTYNLALCFQLGTGVEQDPAKAIFWYEQALSLDLSEETKAEAEYNLARCYLRIDMPGKPNTDWGMYWLEQAAEHNNTQAQQLLDSLAEPTPAPAPVAEAPKPAPVKEKKQLTPLSRLTLLSCIFLAGVVVCGVLGNLLNGQWVWYSAGKYSRLYTFLFLNIPNCLGTLVGLPVSTGLGKVFTLLSSLFFLVISVKLYIAPVDGPVDDGSDGVDDTLRRGGHLICCFSFFQMISSVMADNQTALLYIEKSSFSFLPPLSLIAFILLDHSLCDSKEEKRKSICRILACLGFALGTAGFSQLILTHQWDGFALFPVTVNHLWNGIANLCGSTVFGTVVMALIQGICAVTLGLSLKVLITGAGEHTLSVLFGGGVIYALFLFHYLYGWFGGYFYSRIIVLWIFLLVVVFLWSRLARQQSRRHSILTLLGGIGTIAMPLICLDALKTFSPGIIYNLGRFSDLLAPLSNKILAFLAGALSSHQLVTLILGAVLFILFVLFFIVLYAPLIADKDKEHYFAGDPRLVMVCSWVFLMGYLLICTLQEFYPSLGYYICALPLMVFATCLTMCLLQGDQDGLSCHVKGLIVTLILSVLITFFAPIMAVLVATFLCIALGIGVFIGFASAASKPRTKTDVRIDRIANALLGAAAATDIASDYEQGKLSKQEAINLANITLPIFGDKDRKLKEELEKLKNSED